jgi:hypothetical protein
MFSATSILAALFGLAVAAYLVLRLPVWASLSVALGAVVIVAVGGGVLLAKALVVCGLILAALKFMQRRER